jgi:xylose isomerase
VTDFFKGISPVKFEGPQSSNPLAYRHYNKDEIVLGKRMEDHIRPAIAYWHTFAWEGGDPFGGRSFDRPWYAGSPMEGAKLKADVAFEMFELMDAPFFCFHDVDVAPEGATLAESNKNLRVITDIFAKKMQSSRTKLLWGTANLFSNRRYMAGAATNPDPYVFAYAAAQVKEMLEITHELGGANYVLWGGREGYETLLNTRIKQEQDQAARFLGLVIEHAKKIGYKGQILIEPKPQEPTKHQYDYDVATVYGFLKTYGFEKDVKVNIEVGHAFLAGHSFEHELAVAGGLGILGSVDANRNDLQSGWDTDQFPNNPGEMALAFYQILKAGGLGKGGFNFDAKVRRQSIDPVDLLHGHIGGLDILARGLKGAAAMIEDGTFDKVQDARYAGWQEQGAAAMLSGGRTLEQIAQWVDAENINPQPKSGQQEYLENLVNRFI